VYSSCKYTALWM